MSRRKQTKPLQWQSDSDDETTQAGSLKPISTKRSGSNKPHNYLPVATSSTTESTTNIVSVSTTTEATTSTTNSSSYYRKAKSFQTTHENGKDSFESNKYKHFALTTKPNGQFSFKNDMLSLVASKSIMPPRKRGRPSSQNLQKSRAVLAAAISAASPRRQSLRLRRSNMAGLTPADRAREKLSHRTCEYCGVVKPTPAALQRHIRKHTGERPFVCQICNKGYKAKRSLFLHQTSYHPELFQNDGTISSITTNLLRETLETRRLAKLNPRHHLIIANDSGSSFTQSGSGMKKTKRDMDEELHESKPSHPHEETALASCSLTNSVTPAEEWNADESAEDIAKRSCPYCFKVCPKPSDLKRHLMVHTGERPFRCQECHKKFKQKGSLLYHQKAAHDLNVELSQGLEERYLRLKTRSAMRSLAAIDGLSSHPSNSFLKDKDSLPDTPIGSLIETESDSSHPLQKQLPLDRVPCSSYSSEFRQGLRRQISNTSECSWSEDVSNSVNVLEIELPDSFNSLLSSADDKSSVKKRMMVRKESIFMTRLDGVCLNTGQKLMAYKCYVCSKLFPSLPGIHSHLATHFDSDVMSFDCQICSETFKSLPEMADHLQAQHKLSHCDLDIDLDNNNVCHSDPQGDSHKEKLNQHHNFRIASRFDDHNNNDVLKLKGCPLMEVDNLPFPGSSADSSSSHEVSLPDSSASEREHTRTTHGVHCCPFCRKGFTSQYLLQRHMQLHQQQFAIQALSAAAYKGVGINGFHPDILSHHPAFHPLQSEKRGLEKNNYRLDQDGGKSVEDRRDLHGTTAEQGVEEKSMSVCFEHLEVRSCEEPNIAKELLAKEGIQEDVTVVLPLDPECEPESLLSTPASELHLKADTTCDSQKGEIRCAPKRSLLPVRKESTGTKSRRKASLPTRFDIKNKVLESTEPISGNTSSSPCLPKSPSLLSSVPSLEPEQLETSLFQDQESTSYLQRHLSLDGDHKELKNSLKDEEMLEKQASYVQSLHAAYGHLQASIFGNGFSTAATMALAAGLLGPFASPVLPNLNLVSGHIALASSTPLSSSYLHPPSPRDLDPQAEDLSTPPGRSLSVSHPDTTTQMTGLLPTTSNSKTDSLVGYPRVLWPQAEDKKSPSSSPSRSPPSLVGYPQVLWPRAKEDNSGRSSPSPPPLSPSPSSSDLVSAKQLKPVWHAFTSDDLRNSTTADGRKVTSLSRTHSRLYVVNQPVDRERICKPSVMPDGRTVYRCIFCHKDFLSYSDINRHMDFHEDIRPYKCNFCEYYARTNSQLKVHMMRHQGIREYCCRLCNYKGVTQSDLNRHMKSQIHLLKSRNECHRCGEGFVTAKNLDKHLSSSCSGRHKMDSDLNFHREAVATL